MSAGLTGISALEQGIGQYEAGRERSSLFRANADVARQQFQSEAQAGAYNETAVRMRGQAMEGQQVNQIGGSGLQMRGTPTQVVGSTAEINEMDALQTRNNALRRAYGFEVQGMSDTLQSEMASRAGLNQGLDSILSGGGKAYQQYNSTGSLWGGS